MDLDKFLEDYETFLDSANANLSRKASKNRVAFIEEALQRVSDFVRHAPNRLPKKEHMMILGGHKADKSQKRNTYVMTEKDFKHNEDQRKR